MAEYGDDLLVVSECDHGQVPEATMTPRVGNFWFDGGDSVFVPVECFEEDYPDDGLEVNAVMV